MLSVGAYVVYSQGGLQAGKECFLHNIIRTFIGYVLIAKEDPEIIHRFICCMCVTTHQTTMKYIDDSTLLEATVASCH